MLNGMPLVTISKGEQITIPANLREKFGFKSGSRIEVEETKSGVLLKPIGEDLEKLFEEAKHIKPKRHITAEEMDVYTERMMR